jgi:hypothetical protein
MIVPTQQIANHSRHETRFFEQEYLDGRPVLTAEGRKTVQDEIARVRIVSAAHAPSPIGPISPMSPLSISTPEIATPFSVATPQNPLSPAAI